MKDIRLSLILHTDLEESASVSQQDLDDIKDNIYAAIYRQMDKGGLSGADAEFHIPDFTIEEAEKVE